MAPRRRKLDPVTIALAAIGLVAAGSLAHLVATGGPGVDAAEAITGAIARFFGSRSQPDGIAQPASDPGSDREGIGLAILSWLGRVLPLLMAIAIVPALAGALGVADRRRWARATWVAFGVMAFGYIARHLLGLATGGPYHLDPPGFVELVLLGLASGCLLASALSPPATGSRPPGSPGGP